MVEQVLDARIPVEVVVYDPQIREHERGAHVLDQAQRAGVRLVPALPRVIAACSQVKTPQGLVAVAEAPRSSLAAVLEHPEPLLVVADRLQDPGNLGTIIRIADAAGATAVGVTPGTVDPYHSKVLRATMGSIFHLPIVQLDPPTAIALFRAHGVRILVADPMGSQDYTDADYRPPVAIVLGNEGEGPAPPWVEAATARVRIPLYGRAESLNVAVAAGVLLYEVRRRTS